MHIHAMHLTNTNWLVADAQTCTKSAKYVTVYDANRAAHAPVINYKITIATILGRTCTNKLWELACADMLRPMAIGHPIT